MKKGVLIVSFGTSYREAEAQNINPVEQAISAALPGYEMRRAYGSRRIIKKLKERDGICIDTVSEALETLAVAGCKELIVQPTYVIHGYEYDELVEILREYLNQFESVRLGHPLLHQQSDYKELICGRMKFLISEALLMRLYLWDMAQDILPMHAIRHWSIRSRLRDLQMCGSVPWKDIRRLRM